MAPEASEASVTPVRLAAPFSFYDDDGCQQKWFAGQLETNGERIALLRERGAAVAEVYGSSCGLPPLPGYPTEPDVRRLYTAACLRHQFSRAAVMAIESHFDRYRRECEEQQRFLDEASLRPRAEIDHALAKQAAILQAAETLFERLLTLSTIDVDRLAMTHGAL